MDEKDIARITPTENTRNPNISTENQPKGGARRPSNMLDRGDGKAGGPAK